MKNLKTALYLILWVAFVFLSAISIKAALYGYEKSYPGWLFFGFAGVAAAFYGYVFLKKVKL